MARPRSHREMETLSETLGRKKRTQGKIAPVPKRSNPYLQPSRGGGTRPTSSPSPTKAIGSNSTNLLGLLAQTRAQANRAPVSTDINVSYESDPVLARIRALGQQNVGNAETEAAALRKQAIIDTGLADVGQEIGLDANTLQAARENPNSVASRIQRESQERGRALDESLNQQNLFYGGFRAEELADLARETQEAQTGAVRDLRGVLGGIDAGLLDARTMAASEEQRVLEQIAAEERQSIAEQAYLDSLAALLAPPPVDPMASAAMPGLPDQFITDETAALAGVDPYYYDPYEEELALALAMNPINPYTAV